MIERSARLIEPIMVAIQSAPVPTSDGVWRHHRSEQNTLEVLQGIDIRLVDAAIDFHDFIIELAIADVSAAVLERDVKEKAQRAGGRCSRANGKIDVDDLMRTGNVVHKLGLCTSARSERPDQAFHRGAFGALVRRSSWMCTLVARTILSRRPLSALPTISSDSPWL